MAPSHELDARRAMALRARDLLEGGYHCSEAVLLAVGPVLVRDWDPAFLRLANGFAGGLGGSQAEVCGALAGGVMVIGALFGREQLQDDTLAQRLSRQFRERFHDAFGETQCAPLRNNVVKSEGGLGSCAVVVERATMILLTVLAEAGVRLPTAASDPAP